MKAGAYCGATPLEAWRDQALRALIEAQSMSEVIDSLVSRVIDDAMGDASICKPLEAVRACLMRLDAAVDPTLVSAQIALQAPASEA